MKFENFKKQNYKPSVPFTEDQIAYLEDKITNLMIFFSYMEKANAKLKRQMQRFLKEIKEIPGESKK